MVGFHRHREAPYFIFETVKATLAKKELQETFLEFDLLGVVKRWLQVMHETENCRGSCVCVGVTALEAGPFCCCDGASFGGCRVSVRAGRLNYAVSSFCCSLVVDTSLPAFGLIQCFLTARP